MIPSCTTKYSTAALYYHHVYSTIAELRYHHFHFSICTPMLPSFSLSFFVLFLFIIRFCVFNKTTYQNAHLWMIFRLNLEYCRELWSQLKVCVTKVRYVLSCTFRLLLLKVFSMLENKWASHTVEFNGMSFLLWSGLFFQGSIECSYTVPQMVSSQILWMI